MDGIYHGIVLKFTGKEEVMQILTSLLGPC